MTRVLVLIASLLTLGCSDAGKPASVVGMVDVYDPTQESQRSKNKYLAYSHRISVTVETSILTSTFKSVIDTCAEDQEYSCLVMHSEHSGGAYAHGNIRLRVSPKGIPKYTALVAAAGEVEQQSTSAEDLTDAVVDTEKRLEMLSTYQAKLAAIEKSTTINIDSLIKVSAEIAEVQTQIEFAQGEKAKLYQRINMDELTITLQTKENESFISPIGEAFSDFGENLSEGMAIFITALAFLLPWTLLLVVLVWFIRFLWIRGKRRKN